MIKFLDKLDSKGSKRLTASVERAGIGFWNLDLKEGLLICSDVCKSNYGKNPDEPFSYETLQELIHEDDIDFWRDSVGAAIAECRPFKFEYRTRWADGSIHWVVIYGDCSGDENGVTTELSGISVDITDLKRTEEKLRDSQKTLIEAQKLANLGNWEWDLLTNEVSISEETKHIFDVTDAQASLQDCIDRLHPDDRIRVAEAMQEAVKNNSRYDIEYRFSSPGKEEKIIRSIGEVFFDKSNQPVRMSGTIQDVTAQRTTEYRQNQLTAQIKNQQEYLNNIITNLPGVIWESQVYTNGNTERVDFVSDYIEKMTGYTVEDWLARPNFWLEILHPDDRERALSEAQTFLQTGGQATQQYRWVAKSGESVWVETRMVATHDQNDELLSIQGISMDVTERKYAEEALRKKDEQLLQAQKLESIGRLAGGIAHDFNNMLTAINGYSDLILKNMEFENPLYRQVMEIRKAGDRSAQLTNQLLAFSRQQILKTEKVCANSIIRNAGEMLTRLIGEDLKIVTIFNNQKSMIEVDPSQMVQVILNLVINSRDAMPRGGTLTIETENITVGGEPLIYNVPSNPGPYVKLTVSDNGTGMDEETLTHIFEPFFTTKEIGKGTGLGLATVYGIIKQSGGYVWVESELGKGTTFTIYFPRVAGSEDEKEQFRAQGEFPSGSETILLVEDEKMVRTLTASVLERSGYKIIEASTGMEALALCQDKNLKIDLLITDVVMPEMGGHDLVNALTADYPELPVIYTSGYTNDVVLRHGITDNGINFIPKPFRPDELSRRVRQILDKNN